MLRLTSACPSGSVKGPTGLSAVSEVIGTALGGWLEQMDDEERRSFVGTVLSLFESTGADTFGDIGKQKRKSLEGLELTVSSTDSALHQEIFTQSTTVLADCRKILLSALEGYVTEGEEADYRKTVESQLSLLADQLQLRFQTVTEQTQAMGSELRQQLTEVYKYFNFSQDGLVIGSGDSAITLTLDNSGIVFQKNGAKIHFF